MKIIKFRPNGQSPLWSFKQVPLLWKIFVSEANAHGY